MAYEYEYKIKKCPICGKGFHPAPEHAWKIGPEQTGPLVCSYTCMRKWEKEHPPKKKIRRVIKGGNWND